MRDDVLPNGTLTPESIIALRRRLGLNQTAFAVRLNELVPGLRTTQITVSRWERGIHPPSGVAAEAMAVLREIDRQAAMLADGAG